MAFPFHSNPANGPPFHGNAGNLRESWFKPGMPDR